LPGLPSPALPKSSPALERNGKPSPTSTDRNGAAGDDPDLDEATRILADYIDLLGGQGPSPNLSQL
jgi:hypothetical protein